MNILGEISYVTFYEYIYFRDNFLKLDVYFPVLKFESLEQRPAYILENFFSKQNQLYFLYNSCTVIITKKLEEHGFRSLISLSCV